MSKVAIQVPLKGTPSRRLPGKNFALLLGKELRWWLLDELSKMADKYDVYVDSESDEVLASVLERYNGNIRTHKRHEWFASDAANGNHLIYAFALQHPQYDVFVQAHVTSPTLRAETIEAMVAKWRGLTKDSDFDDAVIAVTPAPGWYRTKERRLNGDPLRPGGMCTALVPVYREANVHVIGREAIFRYGCRVGPNPYLYEIPHSEAVDIDTEEDMIVAALLLQKYWDIDEEGFPFVGEFQVDDFGNGTLCRCYYLPFEDREKRKEQ